MSKEGNRLPVYSVVSVSALLLQVSGSAPTLELWRQVKQSAIEQVRVHGGFPFETEMPCGYKLTIHTEQELLDLPVKNIPCPCRNPKHWLVRFKAC